VTTNICGSDQHMVRGSYNGSAWHGPWPRDYRRSDRARP
jgi:hypothetical protein